MNPDPAAGVFYAKWGFALIPIVLGLFFQLFTLVVAAVFIRDCLKTRRFKHVSGFPIVGPIFICIGLGLSPSSIPAWLFLLPWGIEILVTVAAIAVQKSTHAQRI